jgi:hypothetical protein
LPEPRVAILLLNEFMYYIPKLTFIIFCTTSHGLLLEGEEDTDTLKKFRILTCTGSFKFGMHAFGKYTTKATHTIFEINIFTYGKAAANWECYLTVPAPPLHRQPP